MKFLKNLSNRHKNYLNNIYKKGLFESFKNGNLKDKSLLILNTFSYKKYKSEIERDERVRKHLFFKKIKKKYNIKDIKNYSKKQFLYEILLIPSYMFYFCFISFFLLLLSMIHLNSYIKEETLKNSNSFSNQLKEVSFIQKLNVKEAGLNPISVFKQNEVSKLNREEYISFIEYSFEDIKFEDDFIIEDYSYYAIDNEDYTGGIVLDHNLEVIQYAISYNNGNDFFNGINYYPDNIYQSNNDGLNILSNKKNAASFGKMHYVNHNSSILSFLNPYTKIPINFENKTIKKVNQNVNVFYNNSNTMSPKEEAKVLTEGKNFQDFIDSWFIILLFLWGYNRMAISYIQPRYDKLINDNKKHILNEYGKYAYNNEQLLLEDKSKEIVKNEDLVKFKNLKIINI